MGHRTLTLWKRQGSYALLWVVGAAVVSVLLADAEPSRARGQIFLPNGEPIQAVTRFILGSEDARRNPEYYFTDSQGRFVLQGLANNAWYKISVETDNQTYATTTESFLAGPNSYVQVHLRPLEHTSTRPDGSIVSAGRLAHQPSKKARKAYEQGVEAIKKQQVKSAKLSLRRALELDPTYTNAYNELAVLEMFEENYVEAEHLLRRAVEMDPKSVHALLNLGITQDHLQKYAEAIPTLREVLRLEPGLVSGHLHLGIALLETDALEDAERELTRAARSAGSDDLMTQLYLGKLYARTGDFEKSIAAFTTYLQKAPNAGNTGEVRALIERMKREIAAKR